MRCSVVICWTRSLLLYAQFPAHAHGGADRLQVYLDRSRVSSQIPVSVLGTMRDATRARFFCFEATSFPWTVW